MNNKDAIMDAETAQSEANKHFYHNNYFKGAVISLLNAQIDLMKVILERLSEIRDADYLDTL